MRNEYLIKTLTIVILVLILLPHAAYADFIKQTLWNFVVTVFGGFAAFGGLFLNVGINKFVIGFGDIFKNEGLGVVVNSIWTIIRDLINIGFIFGLIYIGLKMILGADNHSTRTWLVHLILAALLVNFSLLISKFVVDFSNTLAAEIANSSFSVASDGKLDVSQTFLNSLGVQSVLNWEANSQNLGDKGYLYIFGTAIIFLIMVFVFAAGGIMLIIRFAALILFMIFSPLMFIGWIFPQLQNISSSYWKKFIGRAFFAPIYILLLYISASVLRVSVGGQISGYDKVLSSNNGAEVINSFDNSLPMLALAAIFLIASIIIANKLGSDGANVAMSMGRRFRKGIQHTTGMLTLGAGAATLRNTVGRGSYALTKSQAFKTAVANHPALGKYAYKAAEVGAKSSFDVRNVGGLGRVTGLGYGKRGGFAKTVKDREAAEKKFAKSIHVDYDKNNPEYIAKVNAKEQEIRTKTPKDIERVQNNKRILSESQNKDSDTIQNEIDTAREELAALQKELKTAKKDKTKTKEEIEKIVDKLKAKQDEITYKELAKNMSANDYEATRQALDDQIRELEKKKNKAREHAIAEVKYANEIAYMKHLESSAKFWDKWSKIATGAGADGAVVGGAVAGVAGSALLGGVGVGAGIAMGAHSARAKAAHAALIKEYGKDGTAKVKKEQAIKAAKIRQEADKELLQEEGAITSTESKPDAEVDNA